MTITDNYRNILKRIEDACSRAGRDPSSVQLLGASKTKPVETIRKALDAGLTLIGENRVQDAREKFPLLPRCKRHFIGHLQTNKVKDAVELFDCIESVDSIKIAFEINRRAAAIEKIMPVFVEVNVGGETSKHGFSPSTLPEVLDQIKNMDNLTITGLMCIPPAGKDPRPYFRIMAELKNKLRFEKLSMGMSDDFEIAIEEGSNIVRIGTALFGKRI